MPARDPHKPDLRAINVEKRRQRILAASLEVIQKVGVDGLSMRKIAEEAGLAVTTLYNLFGSRDDIVHALVLGFVDEIERYFDAHQESDDPLVRLRSLYSLAISRMVENSSTYKPALVALYRSISSVPDRLELSLHRMTSASTAALAQAQERGLIRADAAPATLSAHLNNGFVWVVYLWAEGLIDAEEFNARSLYGINLLLLAVAADATRPDIEAELARFSGAYASPLGGPADEDDDRTAQARSRKS